MESSNKKTVADSQVELNQFMMPEHANIQGNVHGGIIMKLVDEAGALCAIRHAQRPAVTVAIDSMTFLSPVNVGDVINLQARLNYHGKTSMEVEVKVVAEDPITGDRKHTNSAYAVYVALNENGRPMRVPELSLISDDDRQRWEAGKARQQSRLKK